MEHAKFWQEFFQLYKDLPALWRVRSTEYTDRVLKSNCYLKLVRKLREVYPDADREMVVKKINNFRTSYRKELKRLKENKQIGKTYKPTLWYFDCLSFLDEQDENVMEKTFNEDENPEEVNQSDQCAAANTISSKKLPSKNNDFRNNPREEVLPSASKKQKLAHIHRKNQSKKLSYEEKQEAKSDADTFAQYWAVQYKELQGSQQLIARKLISDILFYGCLGVLNMSHVVELQEMFLRETANAPQPQSPIDSNSSFRLAEQEGYLNYESVRESPLDFNSSSPPLSPTTNSVPEFQVNEIKFEEP